MQQWCTSTPILCNIHTSPWPWQRVMDETRVKDESNEQDIATTDNPQNSCASCEHVYTCTLLVTPIAGTSVFSWMGEKKVTRYPQCCRFTTFRGAMHLYIHRRLHWLSNNPRTKQNGQSVHVHRITSTTNTVNLTSIHTGASTSRSRCVKQAQEQRRRKQRHSKRISTKKQQQ